MDFFGKLFPFMGKKKEKLADYSRYVKITDSACLLKITEIEHRKEKAKKLDEEYYRLSQQINLNEKERQLLVARLYVELEAKHPEIRTPETSHLNYFRIENDYYFVAEDREGGA